MGFRILLLGFRWWGRGFLGRGGVSKLVLNFGYKFLDWKVFEFESVRRSYFGFGLR